MKEELNARRTWEQTRLIAYYSVKPHVKRNTMNTVDSLFKFDWEKKKDAEVFKPDEMEYIIKKYGRFYDSETDKFVN